MKRSLRVGSGIGPRTCAPVRLAVSTISAVAVAPRLGALLGSQIRLTEVQIEPAVNYDKPAHYTYLTTERKRIASKVNSLWVISQVRSAHF